MKNVRNRPKRSVVYRVKSVIRYFFFDSAGTMHIRKLKYFLFYKGTQRNTKGTCTLILCLQISFSKHMNL